MSVEIDENPRDIDPVDVKFSENENVENYENTGDFSTESGESCSIKVPTLKEGVVLPAEVLENCGVLDLKNDTQNNDLDKGSSPNLSSRSTGTPDINSTTGNLLNFNEYLNDSIDFFSNIFTENKDVLIIPEINDETASTKTVENIDNHTTNSYVNLQITDQSLVESSKILHQFSIDNSNFENACSRMLTTSTASLYEHSSTENKTTTIYKPPYSRSADNISNFDQKVNENLNSSTKKLNSEKILTEFHSQKNKAAATQNIVLEQQRNVPEPHTDLRYARIPKELLPQDLGSLVKNIHGIFTSVSGSLKYAYNQTQRAPKPSTKTFSQPITNGKVMDDIFEDQVEKNSNQVIQNGAEKSPTNSNIQITENINNDSMKELMNADEKETDEEPKTDVLKLQIELLEKSLAEQRKENAALKEKVRQQDEGLHEKDQHFKQLESKLDLMSKRAEHAEREKDAAVMRYAGVACAAIEANKIAEKAQAAETSAHNELELLNNKLKSAHREKARICQLYDDKCHELSTSEKELAKVREDFKELEGRLKWTQSKLRMEIDAYKERAERAETLEKQVAELEQAKDTAAASAQASDTMRANRLEQKLKERQAALILCRHEKAELEKRLSFTSHQLESCTRERDSNIAALATALADIEKLKESNLQLEEEAAELAALRAQAALADTLGAQLAHETERAALAEATLSIERARAETCARREAAALEHAARLTAQHVQQRATTSDQEHKAQALAMDNESLRSHVATLEAEISRLQTALTEEAERRSRETRALARKVAELTEEVAEANKRLEWEQGENGVLKRKHANAIKELNRELQRALKRCEQLEAKLPVDDGATRTGSISSLSSGDGATPIQEDRLQNGHKDALPDIQVREPDRQALIERIVSLQRAAARRSERCEFLEEHARQLTSELRGKSKLLRHLLCSLPAGAVADTNSDAHKKEIARLGGGAMAAVWGGERGGMTLELSIEMNTKLQAVLEDALLKNITLKENLDTLGEEIARLKQRRGVTTDNNAK